MTDVSFVEYKIPAKELRKIAESSIYSNLDFDRPNPEGQVEMCNLMTHSAPQLQVDNTTNTINMPCCKGYCSTKASHGVESGSWYFEVEIIKGSVRVGWGQALAEIQAPIGYDEYGYGISNKQSKILHCSRGYPVEFDLSQVKIIGCHLIISEDLETVDENSPIKTEIETKFPPLNFLTTYNVKQNILKRGAIKFYGDGREILGFENIYRGKYFPTVSIFGDAAVRVIFDENEMKFGVPEGAKSFEQAKHYKESINKE